MTNPNITPELERAARAIYKTLYDDLATDAWVEDDPFDLASVGYDGAIDFVRVASIVLRSLLPPSEGMVDEGKRPIQWWDTRVTLADEVATDVFHEMIQHVLGER